MTTVTDILRDSSETQFEICPLTGEILDVPAPQPIPDHDAQGGWPQYETDPHAEYDMTPADLGYRLCR